MSKTYISSVYATKSARTRATTSRKTRMTKNQIRRKQYYLLNDALEKAPLDRDKRLYRHWTLKRSDEVVSGSAKSICEQTGLDPRKLNLLLTYKVSSVDGWRLVGYSLIEDPNGGEPNVEQIKSELNRLRKFAG